MIYYTGELYERVLQENLENAIKLNVISGYTAPSFINRVMKDFPELSMNIYIGMAREGISVEYHEEYKQIVKATKEKVKIYYKHVPPLTHIKLYELYFSDSPNISFSGSANFTKGGFDDYHEILFQIPAMLSDVFNKVAQGSILCTDSAVGNYIDFYVDEKQSGKADEPKEETPPEERPREETPHEDNQSERKFSYRPGRSHSMVRESHKNTQIKIPLLFPKDRLSSNSGINAWKKNIKPYLISSNQYPFSDFFPISRKFTVYTDDGEKFEAEIDRNDSKKLRINPSIYEYLKKRFNITENRPLTYDDLENYGTTEVLVKRKINEKNAFLFDFSPQR